MRYLCPGLAIAAGASLQVVTWGFMAGAGAVGFRLVFGGFALTPYLLVAILATRPAIPRGSVCGAAAMVLAADIFNFWQVFGAPTSSTSALSLLMGPLWNLFCFIPVGMLVGFAVAKLIGRQGDR